MLTPSQTYSLLLTAVHNNTLPGEGVPSSTPLLLPTLALGEGKQPNGGRPNPGEGIRAPR